MAIVSKPQAKVLNWVSKSDIGKEGHGGFAVCVAGDFKGNEAILECQKSLVREGIPGPLEVKQTLSVGVQVNNEANEIISHVAPAIDIQYVCAVRRSENREALQALVN